MVTRIGLNSCCQLAAGEHFIAIFGSNQSALETVLLKRRVMMPCWLSLNQPTRIDTSAQVRVPLLVALPQISKQDLPCQPKYSQLPMYCVSVGSP